jgi:hypothetical protein
MQETEECKHFALPEPISSPCQGRARRAQAKPRMLERQEEITLEDIIEWIYLAEESTGAGIFWLSDVAGAGKRQLLHGLLGLSFFFDCNIPDRRTPPRNPLRLSHAIWLD